MTIEMCTINRVRHYDADGIGILLIPDINLSRNYINP